MKQILLVDDEIEIQVMLADFLRNYGLKVEAYANGQQANERLREKSYDLIITDLKMPKEDGFSLIYKARNLWPNAKKTPILVITGAANLDGLTIDEHALKENNISLVQKPFDLDDILACVCGAFGLEVGEAEKLLSL